MATFVYESDSMACCAKLQYTGERCAAFGSRRQSIGCWTSFVADGPKAQLRAVLRICRVHQAFHKYPGGDMDRLPKSGGLFVTGVCFYFRLKT